MSLSRRLAALEHLVFGKGITFPCQECGGGGADEVRVTVLEEGHNPLPECKSCGRARSPDGKVLALDATVLVLADLDREDEREPPGGEG